MSEFMGEEVSEDIVILIFLKLSIKDLIKCSVVCKNWHNTVASKKFLCAQIKEVKERKEILVRHVADDLEYFSRLEDSSKTIKMSEMCPFKTLNEFQCFRIVGSLFGVICLADDLLYSTHTIILWNPSIKKAINLPRPSAVFSTQGLHHAYLGFGFRTENDFVVIRLAYPQGPNLFDKCPPYAEYYSVNSGVWKTVCSSGVRYFVGSDSQCFANGVIHWIAYEKNEDDAFCGSLLLLFSVDEEKFRKMLLPLELAGEKPISLSVSESCGSIMVANSTFIDGKLVHISVWIKKDYKKFHSWEKIIEETMDGGGLFSTVYLSDFRDLMGVSIKGELMLYNLDTGLVRSLNIVGSTHSFHMCSYSATLALMHTGVSYKFVQDYLCDYYNRSFTGTLSTHRRWVRISDADDEDFKEFQRNAVSNAWSLNLGFSALNILGARKKE